jgi:SAM-dependent methyltransferase
VGITYVDARMMFEARLRGVSFANTLTVAHLSLQLHPAEVRSLQDLYHAKMPLSPVKPLQNYTHGIYSDEFISSVLGVHSLSILDYSSYEGATIIHDLNRPLPATLWGRFDAIIDGGSLEHVFNFPVAVENLMKMLKTGGYILLKSPANNLCGHGFYQFSPELMFRVFARENGFDSTRIVFVESDFPSVELTPYCHAYEVSDPQRVGSRIGLVSKKPVMMIVEARKTADVSVFAEPPLQSDYVTKWNGTESPLVPRGFVAQTLARVFRRLPFPFRARISGYRELKSYSFSNNRFYQRLRP